MLRCRNKVACILSRKAISLETTIIALSSSPDHYKDWDEFLRCHFSPCKMLPDSLGESPKMHLSPIAAHESKPGMKKGRAGRKCAKKYIREKHRCFSAH